MGVVSTQLYYATQCVRAIIARWGPATVHRDAYCPVTAFKSPVVDSSVSHAGEGSLEHPKRGSC